MKYKKDVFGAGLPLFMTTVILTAILFSSIGAEAAGTAAGTSIDNQASATYEDSNSNNYSANSNTVTITVNSVYSVSLNAPADQSGEANTVVYYAYTVTNSGNDANTFALGTTDGSWSGTLYADDGAGGGTANDGVHQAGETNVTSSTGALAPDETYRLFLAVSIPPDTADGVTDNTVLNVTGSGDGGGGDDTADQVTTTVNAPALGITKNVRNVTDTGSFSTTATADPGDLLEYRIQVTNNGSMPATAVVLSDSDHASTTYSSGSIRIGGSTACDSNTMADDDSNQEAGETCAADVCGQANADGSGNITVYLGNTADESTGGSLEIGSTVYVCFQVTID